MIDSSGKVSGDTASYVAEAMARLGEGKQLAIVASLGGRKVGEASLLNHLLGCKFEDDAESGVWISPAGTNRQVLVVNPVCGSQSDDVSYGRAATLSACLADLVVVNTFRTKSGRPTTAVIESLSALFTEQLRQASDGGGAQRSYVLVAVHGCADGDTEAADVAREQVKAIWESVPKPPQVARVAMADLFDIEYVCLPHYRLEASGFKDAVAELRPRVAYGNEATSLFKSDYSRAVDVENFAVLAEQIWVDACADAEDGLGVTREDMRTCLVASRALFAGISNADRQLKRWTATVGRRTTVDGFGSLGKALLGGALAGFDQATATVSPRSPFLLSQREKLALHIKNGLSQLFSDQVRAPAGTCWRYACPH